MSHLSSEYEELTQLIMLQAAKIVGAGIRMGRSVDDDEINDWLVSILEIDSLIKQQFSIVKEAAMEDNNAN